MTQAVKPWTLDRIAERFEEAAITAHRLPSERVRGYVSHWPQIQRELWEGYADERIVLHLPATPAAIDRFVETTRWLAWLTEEQRHLVWMRARYVPMRAICAQLGCDRGTARRRWRLALGIVADRLNATLYAGHGARRT